MCGVLSPARFEKTPVISFKGLQISALREYTMFSVVQQRRFRECDYPVIQSLTRYLQFCMPLMAYSGTLTETEICGQMRDDSQCVVSHTIFAGGYVIGSSIFLLQRTKDHQIIGGIVDTWAKV